MFKKIVCTQEKHTLIDKDHLGYWSPEKDCCLWLMLQQPVRKSESSHLTQKMPSSESSHLMHRLFKCQSQTTVLLKTPITQMIFFNQGRLIFCCANNLKTWIDAWVDLVKMVIKRKWASICGYRTFALFNHSYCYCCHWAKVQVPGHFPNPVTCTL